MRRRALHGSCPEGGPSGFRPGRCSGGCRGRSGRRCRRGRTKLSRGRVRSPRARGAGGASAGRVGPRYVAPGRMYPLCHSGALSHVRWSPPADTSGGTGVRRGRSSGGGRGISLRFLPGHAVSLEVSGAEGCSERGVRGPPLPVFSFPARVLKDRFALLVWRRFAAFRQAGLEGDSGLVYNALRSTVKELVWELRNRNPERWPSGRRRATRNRLGGAEPSRGFKSHSLRHQLPGCAQFQQRNIRRAVLCGEVAEWSKALAWRASRRSQKCLAGSNPALSAIFCLVSAPGGGFSPVRRRPVNPARSGRKQR